MEISYLLTEDDLYEAQRQLLAARREALTTSPRRFLFAVAGAGLIGWPLWVLVTRTHPLLSETLPRLITFLLVLGAAAAIVSPLKSYLPVLRTSRLDAWAARRMARRAVRQSVLGPVTVVMTEAGLVRKNSTGELRVAWSEVQDILSAPQLIIVRLKGQRRVILVPTRAFADAASAAAFRDRMEALAGRKIGTPPSRPEERRAVRPLLLAILGIAVCLLVLDRGALWYFDPRPGNAPGRVIVYSTRWCPVCERLRQCLGRHQVPFEERDVESSPRAGAEWWALGGSGVPVTLIGQQVVYGLRHEELQRALAQAGHTMDCASSEPSNPSEPAESSPLR
jgi:glutaredoxin